MAKFLSKWLIKQREPVLASDWWLFVLFFASELNDSLG